MFMSMNDNAPKKIYVQLPSRKWIGKTWDETPIKEGDNPNWKNATNIEYTRTDAFIEKACVKLKKLMYDNLMFQGRLHREEVIDNFVEDFKKYLED